MTETVTLNGNPTTKWISANVVDSITRKAGFFEVVLENADESLTDIYEQYNSAEFEINGTTILKGEIDEIVPDDKGNLRIIGKNLLHELQGEYIIESYGISQDASNNPDSGSSIVINIADTTEFEVGDEILVEDNGKNITADSITLLNGVVESGSVTDTETINGTYYNVGERAGDGCGFEIDFNMGDGGRGRTVHIAGRYQGSATHWINVFAWNFDTLTYDEISSGSNRLDNRSTDFSYLFSINDAHFDTDGSAKIKLEHNVTTYNNAHDIFLDYMAIERAGASELANITSIVTDTSITVNTLIRCYNTPTVTVGRSGYFIVNDLVTKYGTSMTREGIPSTSPEKFIRTFKGVTAFDAIQDVADTEEREFGHDETGDFYYQPADFEDSGITITYGVSDVLDVVVERIGSEIINRVDVYGKFVGGVQVAARAEDLASQSFYGKVKGTTIIKEEIETEAEAEALGNSILAEKSFSVEMGTIMVLGYETLRAGQLVTLLSIPGLTDGQYLVVEKEHDFTGETRLKVAQYRIDLDDMISSLVKRMREREKESLDENATQVKLLNFYEDTTSTDVIIEVIKVEINDGYIASHEINSIAGRGFNGVGGTQLKAGRYGTETVII